MPKLAAIENSSDGQRGGLKYEKEKNNKIFEHLCSLVYEYYLMIDYSSINDVANVICDSYYKNEKISEKNIREKLENMYL